MRIKSSFLPTLLGLALLATNSSGQAVNADETDNAHSSNAIAMSKPTQAQPQKKRNFTESVLRFQVSAPQSVVWETLTDFQKYPKVFKRLQSCRVLKRDGDTVYTETLLRPHMFVNEPVEHEVNDLSAGPTVLNWHSTDGNFKAMDGTWDIKPQSNDKCTVTYRLGVDASGCIPAPLIGFVLRTMQKEIIDAVKRSAESAYSDYRTKTSKVSPPHATQGEG